MPLRPPKTATKPQSDADADGATDECRTIAPPFRHDTTEERSDRDRSVVRCRVPRVRVAGAARRGEVADQRECARGERRDADTREAVDRHERKVAFDQW